MQIFLETERLVLRQFTEDDVGSLVELDSDPDVMHFINGGRPTLRHEIESDVLPAFLDYYERFAGYGFWAAIEKRSIRGMVPFPTYEGCPPQRGRARLPAAQIGLGEGLCDRRVAGADP